MKSLNKEKRIFIEKLHLGLKVKFATLLLIVFSIQISANYLYGQGPKVTLDIKNANIEKVISEIESITEYKFFFNSKDVDLKRTISLNASDENLSTVLDKAFKNYGINYKIIDKQIVLTKNETSTGIQQSVQLKITGKVTDHNNLPLPGVNIIIEGKRVGVATHLDGTYSITANIGDVLLFSYIGFESQKIVVAGKSTINTVMIEQAAELMEATLISTGYQTVPKERATGSFTVIKRKDITRQITTDLVDRLEGLAPGLLTTTENGDFGGEVKLTLRGQGTFEADDQPLIIVDGFPIEGGFNTINPSDVESITVLKDASAASIWGTRAGNGVIVITTIRGKSGKPAFEYSTSFSIEQRPDLNRLPIASSASQITQIGKLIELDRDSAYSGYVNLGGVPNLTGSLNAVQQVYANKALGLISESELASKLAYLGNVNSFDQYQEYLLRDALRMQHNLSFSGGGKNNRYFASLTFNDDKSNSIGDDSQRVNLNLKNDIDFTDKLRFDVSINTTFNKANLNSEGLGLISGTAGSSQNLDRFQNLVDPSTGDLLNIPRHFSFATKEQYEKLGYLDWSYNPIADVAVRDNSSKRLTLRLQGGLEWDITSFLKWRASGMYEYIDTDRRNHYSMDTYEARHNINFFTLENAGKLTHQLPLGGILRNESISTRAYTLRTQLGFDKKISNIHQVVALAGVEAREIAGMANSNTLLGYNDDLQSYSHITNWALLNQNVINFQGKNWPGGYQDRGYVSEDKDRFISFFVNASYTYDRRYTLTGSAKIEQASIFGLDAKLRANKLWSIGGSWNISNEKFFRSDFVNSLQLRASYGVNGNVKRGLTTETVLRTGSPASPYIVDYLRFSSIGNPNITQEDNYVTNIGVDFRIIKRLSGTIEYYKRTSDKLLTFFPVSSTYGMTSQFFNNGKIINKGVEFNLGGDVVRAGGFTYNANFNFSYNKGEVVEYNDVVPTANFKIANHFNRGEDPGAIFTYQWAGLSADGVPQIYDENGDVQLWSVDVTSVDAVKVAGTTIPKFYGSFNSLLSFKGLSLGIYLTYKMGHSFIAPSYEFGQTRIHEDIDRRWVSSGDESKTNVARFPTRTERDNVKFTNWNKYYAQSNAVIEDASFIRLRDISVNYDFNKRWLNKLPFEGIRLTAQVRNVGFLWRATNLDVDPDILPFSGGFGSETLRPSLLASRPGTPSMPIFSIGIRLNF